MELRENQHPFPPVPPSFFFDLRKALYPRLFAMQPSLHNPRCLPWKIAEGRVYLLTRDHVFVFLFYQSQYSLEDRRKYGCHNLFLAWKCQTSECLFVVFTRDMESSCSCRYLFPNATAEKVYVQTFARKNSSNWLCVWILGRFSFGR